VTAPYKYAHLYVLLALALTFIAFWPSYFSSLGTAPLAFHAHGLATTIWISLVALQSWSIRQESTVLHRRAGLFSLLLFPLLIASFVLIINVSAARFAGGEDPFFEQAGPILGFIMASAIVAYLLLFAQALRHRSNMRLHALYMLATAVILAESAFGRLLQQTVPSMSFDGSGDFQSALNSIVVPHILAAVVAIVVYLRDRKNGLPFLLAAVLLVTQFFAIYWLADSIWLRTWFELYSKVPDWLSVGLGFGLGAVAVWVGWSRPADSAPLKQGILVSADPARSALSGHGTTSLHDNDLGAGS
jgi:hypothetical protein